MLLFNKKLSLIEVTTPVGFIMFSLNSNSSLITSTAQTACLKPARPTETNKPACKARYVHAGDLEDIVWGKVKEILYESQTVVAEIKRQLLEADELNDSNKARE